MSYLYGDSTTSSLQVNYIEFLRDAVDFCVQILLADQRMVDGRARIATQEQVRSREMERLEKLGAAVVRALAVAPTEGESATARCAAAIQRSAEDLVRAQINELRAHLADEVAKVEAQAGSERDGCAKALEVLLRKHDLPESRLALHLTLTGGTRYASRAQVSTAFGLDAHVDLEIPAGHLFSEPVRIERVLERLEIQAPEVGGWLHKEVKLRPQRLERHYVTELVTGADQDALKLRAAAEGASPGFDVLIHKDAPRVGILRVEERDGAAAQPFDATEADTTKLLALHEKLAAAVAELGRHRKAVQKATFDKEPLGAGDRLPMLVERLVAVMAPVVQEIAARSLAPGELVLRRLLGDDRREEIFVSKADLKSKVEGLREPGRSLFDLLWADPTAVAASSRRPPPPPPRSTRTPPFGSPLPGPVVVASPDNDDPSTPGPDGAAGSPAAS
jgi:hypothetical protein